MTLDQDTIQQLAAHVENAELTATAITKITDAHPGLDWDDAYAIQHAIRLRKEAPATRSPGSRPA